MNYVEEKLELKAQKEQMMAMGKFKMQNKSYTRTRFVMGWVMQCVWFYIHLLFLCMHYEEKFKKEREDLIEAKRKEKEDKEKKKEEMKRIVEEEKQRRKEEKERMKAEKERVS